jgi:hypothetical protein
MQAHRYTRCAALLQCWEWLERKVEQGVWGGQRSGGAERILDRQMLTSGQMWYQVKGRSAPDKKRAKAKKK